MKSYLVSGAGSGIGRAIALKIASTDPSHRVFLLGRNRDRLLSVQRELPRSEQHEVLIADLSEPKGLNGAILDARLDECNLVSIVANAGVGGENHYGPNDRWNEIIETNLSGTYRFIQECLPALRSSQEKHRSIVMVSSILARIGVPGYSAYCASKAGLLGLTRSLAAELAAEKILANAICPGWVETEMALAGLHEFAKNGLHPFSEVREAEMAKVPLGKMSKPEEIAELVYFLIGGSQDSITGQTFDINNGALMA